MEIDFISPSFTSPLLDIFHSLQNNFHIKISTWYPVRADVKTFSTALLFTRKLWYLPAVEADLHILSEASVIQENVRGLSLGCLVTWR